MQPFAVFRKVGRQQEKITRGEIELKKLWKSIPNYLSLNKLFWDDKVVF